MPKFLTCIAISLLVCYTPFCEVEKMDKELAKKYKDNEIELAVLETRRIGLDFELARMEAQKTELLEKVNMLKQTNHKSAKENYIFSFGELAAEIISISKSLGYRVDPEIVAYVSATIWNSGKRRAKAKSVEECCEYLEDNKHEFYRKYASIRLIIRKPAYGKCPDYCFEIAKKLDFDMPMCDGSKLQDKLFTIVEFDDLQGCYYTKLLLNDGAAEKIPVVIDPTNYPKDEANGNNIVFEAFANLIERRNAENESGIKEKNS